MSLNYCQKKNGLPLTITPFQIIGIIAHMHFQRSKYKPHSAGLSEVEIDMELTKYFAENQIITRKDFQYQRQLWDDTNHCLSAYKKTDCGKETAK